MFNLQRNRRFAAAIVAILLTLSSSGFTAVLHSCLMAERVCCDQPMSMMARMPAEDGAFPGSPVLQSDMSCCSVTVAGGLNTNPIVAGNQLPAPPHLDLIALLPSSALSVTQLALTHPALFSSSAVVSPPSVEKYVLNATFLI